MNSNFLVKIKIKGISLSYLQHAFRCYIIWLLINESAINMEG